MRGVARPYGNQAGRHSLAQARTYYLDYVTGWGAPSIDPALDEAITHLWVVHEGTRRGWLWNGESWRELSDL